MVSEYSANPPFHKKIIFMIYELQDIACPLFFLSLDISF